MQRLTLILSSWRSGSGKTLDWRVGEFLLLLLADGPRPQTAAHEKQLLLVISSNPWYQPFKRLPRLCESGRSGYRHSKQMMHDNPSRGYCSGNIAFAATQASSKERPRGGLLPCKQLNSIKSEVHSFQSFTEHSTVGPVLGSSGSPAANHASASCSGLATASLSSQPREAMAAGRGAKLMRRLRSASEFLIAQASFCEVGGEEVSLSSLLHALLQKALL
ncbi:hypothetical protein Efla_001209 [Eimeria flavescens]